MSIRNKLLEQIAIAHGASVTNPHNRNQLLIDIVLAAGGTVTNPYSRNQLLEDYLLAIKIPPSTTGWTDGAGWFDGAGWVESEAPPDKGLTFLSLEEQSSPRLFGGISHTFNITAPPETDGAVFIALVQKKNMGALLSTVEIDGGVVVPPSGSISSNPGSQENQLGSFEDKTLTPGAHTVKVANSDGIEGVSLVAVYYKNYTGFTGNFTTASATGAQAAQIVLGDSSWAVTKGKRGLNILFAGGLNNLVSEVPNAEYDAGLLNYSTTDVGDDRFNGRLQTAVDIDFANNISNTEWTIDWSVGSDAEVLMLAGELDNT